LYTAGPSLNGNSVKTAEAADKMVREQQAAGYDFLKLHPGLTLDNFNAIVKAANEVHIPFAGHVSWEVGIWRAITANYASVDHLDGFIEGLVPDLASIPEDQAGFMGIFVAGRADSTQLPKLMKALAEHRIGVVPTQALAERWFAADKTSAQLLKAPEMIYIEAGLAAKWAESKDKTMTSPLYKPETYSQFIKLRRKLIYECQKNGVLLLLGSDAPQVFNVPGFSIHHELQYLVKAGLTPYQALRTGTVNPSLYFNRADAGTIKTGNVSDLVLLNGNPLKDISQSSRIEGVMLADRWLPKEYIAAELKKLVKK
jgi:imidazolonepropionase-like amidohydrolase